MSAMRTRRRPDHRRRDRRRARLDRGRDGPQAGAHGLLVDHPRVRGLRLRALRRPGPPAVRVGAVDAAAVRPDPRLHRRHQPPLRASSGYEWKPGDVVIHNHAYYGASHQPDVAFVVPVFHSGELVGFSATTAHHLDLGALTPGSCGIVDATDAYAEGLQFNAIKIEEEGRRNDLVWQILRDNCRAPQLVVGDMEAQVAAAQDRRRPLPRADRPATAWRRSATRARTSWTTPTGCCAARSRRCPTARTRPRATSTASSTTPTRPTTTC